MLICPFCGEPMTILIGDDEGNIHNESYLDDAYSDVTYMLSHPIEDECPLRTHKNEIIGNTLYDSVEELQCAWDGPYESEYIVSWLEKCEKEDRETGRYIEGDKIFTNYDKAKAYYDEIVKNENFMVFLNNLRNKNIISSNSEDK